MLYSSSKPNLLRDGYEAAAAAIAKVAGKGRGKRYCVYVDWEGVVRWVPRYDLGRRVPEPPGPDLVGTYDRHSRIEDIEGDLIERMRELSKKRRAA